MAGESLRLFRRLGGSAPGRWLYTRLIEFRAPYFGSIGARIESLEPGRCVATLRQRRRVQNHIGTVHAIALCNLAELVGGLATDAAMPPGMRWIPKGMTVRYLKKASGTLRATASLPAVDAGPAREAIAHVDVRDAQDVIVFEADISMWVSPKG